MPTFVVQSFPQAGLAPLDDAFAMARMHEFNSYLASTVHVAHAHKRRGARRADDPAAHEAMRAKVPLANYPALQAHHARVHARPAVQRALAPR